MWFHPLSVPPQTGHLDGRLGVPGGLGTGGEKPVSEGRSSARSRSHYYTRSTDIGRRTHSPVSVGPRGTDVTVLGPTDQGNRGTRDGPRQGQTVEALRVTTKDLGSREWAKMRVSSQHPTHLRPQPSVRYPGLLRYTTHPGTYGSSESKGYSARRWSTGPTVDT